MQRQYILAATKYPRRLCRSRQNFLGYFVAATESPSDKINCDTGRMCFDTAACIMEMFLSLSGYGLRASIIGTLVRE